MTSQNEPSNRPQLSIARMFLWTTCVAVMIGFYRAELQNDSERYSALAYTLFGLHAAMAGTQLTAAMLWMSKNRNRSYTGAPGRWLLAMAMASLIASLPLRLFYTIFGRVISHSGHDPVYWGVLLIYCEIYLVWFAILHFAVVRKRLRTSSRWWLLLFWFLYAWSLMAAVICNYVACGSFFDLTNISPFATLAFSLQWTWPYTGTGILLLTLAVLIDLKNGVRWDGYHWCGAITFGLDLVWTILYRLIVL